MSVVLLSGCSSGLGEASALAFARAGHVVYASMRDPGKSARLQTLAADESLDIRVIELDVTQPKTFASVVERVVAGCGQLDVLVNNAGLLRAGALEDLGERGLREVMETNFFGAMLLTLAVLPQMRRQNGGCVIMMSSLSGIAGLPGDVAYTASKFAIEGATEALRHEVDRWNIRLALVEPGLYATRIFESSLPGSDVLPLSYPPGSPYRDLVEHKLRELRARLPQAFDPALIGELLVEIARSDGTQLRWPADATARKVLATMFAQDDAARDAFLRAVSGTDWWSDGGSAPSPAT
jgi:NAD(P)-dependent dehydrogenase (short-subunit alcohol dehydrogenase family)